MNTTQLPSVELIQGPPPSDTPAQPQGRRLKVFFGVLLLSAAVGLAIVYGRSPVYRAVASVLTVKPKAVDMRSEEADIEHVAIQGRLLLGEELLGRLSQRLSAEGDQEISGIDALRNALSAVPVPETNLLELRAEGGVPEQLQRVVNRWAESYEEFRAEEIEAATGRTTAEIEDQQAQLQVKIDEARGELQRFREAHDIVSLEREENRSLAKLKGLNNSLNKARETLIEAQARKAAVEDAIARGETVIPSEQKSDISRLKLDVSRMRARIADLRQQYTQRYIDRDPVLKSLPAVLSEMESELAQALQIARVTVTDEAQQEVAAAQVSVTALEQQLVEHQRAVQEFTERFKEFKALEEGLARLDALYAENEERLAQIQVRNLKKFPPIQVVEWARVPSRPIYPDYERDLMIALGASLVLALFATWLVEYLGEKSRQAHAGPYLGVRVYAGNQGQALTAAQADNRLGYGQGDSANPTASPAPPAHLSILPRELAGSEVASLLAVADPLTASYATLLLCGISPYELPLLHSSCFDRAADLVSIPGSSRRDIRLGAGVWPRLEQVMATMDDAQMALPVSELNARLVRAAQDAQLADPGSINALALWHTYVIYLIRQGIDASALAGRAGAVPSDVYAVLMHYAPAGGSRPLSTIDFTYPALTAG